LPHKPSTRKRLRQSQRENERNRAMRSAVATAIKKAKAAPPEEREAALRRAVSKIDKAVKVGAYKKRTGNRKKSQLMKALREAQ